jgi:hypothetical protein
MGLALPAYLAFGVLRGVAPELVAPSLYAAAVMAGSLVYGVVTWWLIPVLVSGGASERNPA